MSKETLIQKQIEDIVINGRGYYPITKLPLNYNEINSEVGLQLALAYMDEREGKLSKGKIRDLREKLYNMIRYYEKSGISLGTITTAEGFREATNRSYEDAFNASVRAITESLVDIGRICLSRKKDYHEEFRREMKEILGEKLFNEILPKK